MEHNELLLKKWQELMDYTSTAQLQKSLHQVFFDYLAYMNDEPPANFKDVVRDFYFLLSFLED